MKSVLRATWWIIPDRRGHEVGIYLSFQTYYEGQDGWNGVRGRGDRDQIKSKDHII